MREAKLGYCFCLLHLRDSLNPRQTSQCCKAQAIISLYGSDFHLKGWKLENEKMKKEVPGEYCAQMLVFNSLTD